MPYWDLSYPRIRPEVSELSILSYEELALYNRLLLQTPHRGLEDKIKHRDKIDA